MAKCLLLIYFSMFLLGGVFVAAQPSAEDYTKLIRYLRAKQHPVDVIPKKNTSSPMVVKFGLALINFESLDEVKGILHLNLWFRHLWQDDYMTWDPSNHSGITLVRMKGEDIWTPDLAVYNAREKTETQKVNYVVYSDGSVLHIPPAEVKSHCQLDMTYFPFDTQTCKIKIGSWTYDGNTLDLEFYEGHDKIDLSDYVHNPEWDIIGSAGEKKKVYYPCCAEPYPDLTFNLTLKRHTSYYTYVYIGPAVILSLLVPFIFLLPPADQQKMTLGIGILICFTLFFMEISNLIPTIHSHAPLIDKFYMATYVLVALSMVLSTLVSNLARRAHMLSHPPEILNKVILGCLGRCLCVRESNYSGLSDEGHLLEVKAEGGENVQRQTSTGGHVTKWLLIAVVIDRLLFLTFLILVVLLAIATLTNYPK